MRRINWSSLAYTLFLLLALAWMAVYFIRLTLRTEAEKRLIKEFADLPAGQLPAKIKLQVGEADKALAEYGGPLIALLLAERLALLASYYPEESDPALDRSIRINRALFESQSSSYLADAYSDLYNHAGYMLGWCYQSAGLFEDYSSWKDEIITRAPGLREGMLALQARAFVLSDNTPAAVAMAETELKERPTSVHTEAIAADAFLAAGDLPRAIAHAQKASLLEGSDPNVEFSLASLAIAQEDFHSASQILRSMLQSEGEDADTEQLLLAAVIGLEGLQSGNVAQIAKRASFSTRDPRSVSGAQALALAGLYALTLQPRWLAALEELARRHPQDFHVQAALLEARLDAEDALYFPIARAGRNWHDPGGIAGSANLAAALPALAGSQTQRQAAALLCARFSAHRARLEDSPEQAGAALGWFACALGLRDRPLALADNPVPPYDRVLLDRHVMALRQADPEFSRDIHELVLDYLAARKKKFSPALQVPLGSFGERPRKPSNKPASTQTLSRLSPLTSVYWRVWAKAAKMLPWAG